MYPIPPSEHLVEMRKCRQCMIEFPITDKDMEFYSKVSPVLSIASFGKEVLRNEAEDFPVSESTKSLIAEGKVKILETWAGNPSPAIAGTPFQKGVFLIPPPTLCPDCRQQRRLAFRNERRLYKRKCDATGKDIISIYSPDKPYTVYHQDYWWSDAWDPMSYGREFDFRKSAMENFREIFDRIPKANLWIRPDMINCEYCNFGSYSKNCYMSTASHHSENCLNTNTPVYCISDIDGVFNIQGNNIYECIKTTQCTNVFYSQTCQICKNSWYLLDCIDCDECFGCVGLKHKQYYILNKRYTKIRFYIKISKILSSTKEREKFLKEFLELKATLPFRSTRNIACEHLYGDDTMNSKNSYSVYDCMGLVNSKYATISGGESTDLYDSINGGLNSQCCMETLSTITISHSHFSVLTYNSNFIYYSFHIEGGNHLFLCTGLRNKQYCILNKQYTKEEYEVLVPRIIEHMSSPQPSPEGENILGTDSSSLKERGIGGEVEWGEFFPASMSPFGYNETVAQEYFPLSREEVLEKAPFGKELSEAKRKTEDFQKQEISPSRYDTAGHPSFKRGLYFNWSDYESPFPKVEKIIPASKLPDTIEGTPDDILNWAIECEVSGKPFRIIKQELEFYRKHNLPIPRRHPDIRHMDRMKMRNPRKLFERLCDCESCEENWKKKGVILKEGVDASYFFLEKEIQGDSGTEKKNPPSITTETGDGHLLSKGGLRKKMITTYAPERPEKVYCEVCYEREVIS